jgi:hypothetical protein
MSVFSDFQRLWVSVESRHFTVLIGINADACSISSQQEKFPDSDLSAAWIEDVKLSLARHREKIVELTKELEQETLYVEYLERLLGEVEKYRDSGSDPALLFDAATPTITPSPRLSLNEKNGPADYKGTDEVRRRSDRFRTVIRRRTLCKLVH